MIPQLDDGMKRITFSFRSHQDSGDLFEPFFKVFCPPLLQAVFCVSLCGTDPFVFVFNMASLRKAGLAFGAWFKLEYMAAFN